MARNKFKVKDITGEKYVMLTAVKFIKIADDGNAVWLWRCDCGKELELTARRVKYQQLKDARKSCGCWNPVHKHKGIDYVINNIYRARYADGDLTLEDFKEISQKNCFYCGAEPSNRAPHPKKKDIVYIYNGLDRADNNLPHNKSNCDPCCWTCNEKKGSWSRAQYLYYLKTRYEHCCAGKDIEAVELTKPTFGGRNYE